ncbi:MAG: hypothetical protein U0359_27140 [Byssovorax sp.]
MSNASRWFWACWAAIFTAGCGAGGGMGGGGGDGGGSMEEQVLGAGKPAATPVGGKAFVPLDLGMLAVPDAITWTSNGRVAVVSGKTGAARQVADTALLGGERDLVYDPFQKRLMVFEQDSESDAGEIASYALVPGPNGALLAPRVHESWVDGDLRMLASSLGIVVFEQSYGGWWKLFFSDEESVSSVAAPMPSSAWISPTGSGIAIRGLTVTPGLPLYRRSADAQWTSVSAPVTSSLGIFPAGAVPTARLMPAPARGDAVLFDVTGSSLAMRFVNGPVPGPAVLLPLGAGGQRIEQAVPIDGGEVALLLVSGQSRLVAVEINAAGGIASSAEVALPGAVRKETQFFSHDLALLGPRRALAATSTGVYAVSIGRDAGGVHLAIDPGFDGSMLRGPVEALPPKPL